MERIRDLSRVIHEWGPPAPVFAFACILLSTFTLGRVVLLQIFAARLAGVTDAWSVLYHGFCIDIVSVSALCLAPLLVLLLLQPERDSFAGMAVRIYLALTLCSAIVMEAASPRFAIEFESRPNRIFIEYLSHPREVFTTIGKAFLCPFIVLLFAVAAGAYFSWRWASYALGSYRRWPAGHSIATCFFLVPVLAVCASPFLHCFSFVSLGYFSTDPLANNLCLNSLSTFLNAAAGLSDRELDNSRYYGSMPDDEIIKRVRRNIACPPEDFVGDKCPFLHRQHCSTVQARPFNLVIILSESMGAEYVGRLGGMGITPCLDRLSGQGLFFSKLFSVGCRTVRGIEAVSAGFLPTAGRGVVKVGINERFFTLARLLDRFGYRTSFIYGGDRDFDKMGQYFRLGGFKECHDERTFTDVSFHGTWGIADEELFMNADRIFRSYGETPFFSLILTTSNHVPFDFPDGKTALIRQPKATAVNAARYSDYALGRFFDRARKSSYFNRTVFLFVADHSKSTVGPGPIPLVKFHIPALIIGPGVPRRDYDRLASQIDLPPTALHFLGIRGIRHPMLGRDLMSVPAGVAGRAFMQFHYYAAYRLADRLVILRPGAGPLFFRVRGDLGFEAAHADPELARDALALALAPGMLYYGQRHCITAQK